MRHIAHAFELQKCFAPKEGTFWLIIVGENSYPLGSQMHFTGVSVCTLVAYKTERKRGRKTDRGRDGCPTLDHTRSSPF